MLAAVHRGEQGGPHRGQAAVAGGHGEQVEQGGVAGVLGAVVDDQHGQRVAGPAAAAAGAAPHLDRHPGPQHPAGHGQAGGARGGRPPGAGQPGRRAVAGELDHRLLPEGPVGPERVGRVGQQHRPGARVAQGQLVLHPVNGRPGEAQLPGARRAVPGERRPDPGPLHLLVEPHLLEGGVRVGHPEGHPGRPHLRAGAGGRAGRGHPRSISPPARRGLVGDSLSLPVPAGKILSHSGHQIGGRSVRGRTGPAHLQRSLPRGEPRGGRPRPRPGRPPRPRPPPPRLARRPLHHRRPRRHRPPPRQRPHLDPPPPPRPPGHPPQTRGTPPRPPPRPRPRGRQPPLPPDRPGRPPRTTPSGSSSRPAGRGGAGARGGAGRRGPSGG